MFWMFQTPSPLVWLWASGGSPVMHSCWTARKWAGGLACRGQSGASRCPCSLPPDSDCCKDWTHSLLFVETGSFSRLPLLPDSFGFLGETGPSPSYPLWIVSTSLPRSQPFLSSYLCNAGWKGRVLHAALADTLCRSNFLLGCPASEPLRRAIFGTASSIFDLWSRPWGVARLLGLHGVPPRPHPSEGVG